MGENKNRKLSSLDVEEIARVFCGIDNEDAEIDEIEDVLYRKHGLSYDQFEKVAAFMFAQMDLGVSPLTNTPMLGVSTKDNKGIGCWLAKRDITGEFIGAVIQWLSEGEEMSHNSKGFSRTITSGGKPEYEIIIKRPDPKPEKTKVAKKHIVGVGTSKIGDMLAGVVGELDDRKMRIFIEAINGMPVDGAMTKVSGVKSDDGQTLYGTDEATVLTWEEFKNSIIKVGNIKVD